MTTALPDPPRTPTSSTAFSFLSFSPDPTDQHPSYDPIDTTPRALRRPAPAPCPSAASNATVAPPKRKESLLPSSPASDLFDDAYTWSPSPTTTVFSSRNPFAALLAAQTAAAAPSASPSSSASPPGSVCPLDTTTTSGSGDSSMSPSSPSSASTPTQDSQEDHSVVFDGVFVNRVDGLEEWSGVSEGLAGMLDAFGGEGGGGDVSSAWEDELYSSLSDAATTPSSPYFSTRPRYPSSPSKTPRGGSSSPRKARRTPTSPQHPFRHSSRPGSPVVSLRRSTSTSPSVSRTPSHTGARSSSRTAGAAFAHALASPPLLSAQLNGGFSLAPTSPVHAQQQAAPRFPFMNLSLAPSPPFRLSPPPKPRGKSSSPSLGSNSNKLPRTKSTKSKAILVLEDKLVARAERRRERVARELAKEGKSAVSRSKSMGVIDVDALDQFFGVTPKHAKALKGGYGGIAREEGMVVGGRDGEEERERWRKVQEFRALLDQQDEDEGGAPTDEDGDISSAADASETDDFPSSSSPPSSFSLSNTGRPRPPPLKLFSSSHAPPQATAPYRRASLASLQHHSSPSSSSRLQSDDEPPFSASSLIASPFGDDEYALRTLSGVQECRRRSETALDGLGGAAAKLRRKKSMGERLKDIFVSGR